MINEFMTDQHYELLYIIPVKFVGEEQEKILGKVAKIVKDQGCEITKDEILGKQRLAYPIKHVHQGVYVVVEFDGKQSAVSKINTTLKLTPEVLRFLIIKKKKLTAEEIAKQEQRKQALVQEEKKEKEAAIQKKVEEIKEEKKEAPKVKEEKDKKKEKVSLEDLDKKLDEILKDDIDV